METIESILQATAIITIILFMSGVGLLIWEFRHDKKNKS